MLTMNLNKNSGFLIQNLSSDSRSERRKRRAFDGPDIGGSYVGGPAVVLPIGDGRCLVVLVINYVLLLPVRT